MSALDTAQSVDPSASPRPDAAEVTGWLLEGRWFTIDVEGRITSWSPVAADRFGHDRKGITGESFVETLIAPPSRPACHQAVATALSGAGGEQAGFTGDVDALNVHGAPLRSAFALVPIQLSVGYEFNDLLQEIASRAGSAASLGELKSRHESVIGLIESALTGKAAESAQTEEGGRLAGALVVFRAGEATAAPAAPAMPDNVVSIADAAGVEEVRGQLDRAHTDLEEARTEVRTLEGQLEESRREAQRARNEVDVARQEANDARDALALAQREVEQGQRQIEEARHSAEDARAAAEASRIRAEEAQREAERLRRELREARDDARGVAGQAEDEVAEVRADAARARGEAARHAAEVETLRNRLQETQRELGTLRAEVEAARAELEQGAAISERRGSEAERLRSELEERERVLEDARAESERLTGELNREASQAADTVAQLERARAELDAARAASGPVPTEGEHATLRAVFHGAPVPTALVAPDGRFVDANAALCSLLGYERERLVSDAPPAVVHPDDVDAKLALAARMLAGDESTARCYRRYVHADGQAITMRESLALLRDTQGRPELFVLQVEDADGDEAVDGVVVDAEVTPEDLDAPSEDAIRRALEEETFQLHAQPVIDLRTNTTTQYELLIRMVGEDGSLVLPQAFLGPARRAGLAHAIDRWVVRQAIRLLARLPEEIQLEVNLSPEAIHDSELGTLIDQELATTAVDPARLILEVTGQTAAEGLEATRALAQRIRALGCRFALDDFRSTFGSFRLLKDLPLDYLKLDGELVGSLAESRTSQLIVKALIDVASGTGTKTVAVFVSDENTLMLLRQQGVDYAQGYRVGRPKPIADVWPGDEPAALPAGS
jgi:PAS domain S-box-containing protein